MANTYVKLNTATVGAGGASSVTFSDIPNGYIDLIVKASVRSTDASARSLIIAPNGSTNNLYSIRLEGYGTSGQGGGSTTNGFVGYVGGSSYQANVFSLSELHFTNYLNTNKEKRVTVDNGSPNTNTADWYIASISQGWRDTAPLNSITFSVSAGNLAQYSTFTLYGVFNADVSSPPATPTIGTATAVGNKQATVTFTGVSNAASYTVTSTPGSITGVGNSSPILVSGLTDGTSYTFKIKANNPFGSSSESAASNSIIADAGSFDSIATVTSPAGTSVTFSNIPQYYKHLQLRINGSTTRTGYPIDDGFLRFNGDSGTNYNTNRTTAANAGGLSGLNAYNTTSASSIRADYFCANDVANTTGITIIDIPNYRSSISKAVMIYFGMSQNTSGMRMTVLNGNYRSNNPITSLTIGSDNGFNFTAGTSFSLYGIAG